MKRTITAALVLACTVLPMHASQVVFGNLGDDGGGAVAGTNTDIPSGGVYRLAQGFDTGATSLLYLDNITLALGVIGGGTLNHSISIYSDSGGFPDALLFTSAPVFLSGAEDAKYTYSFSGVSLDADTSYWVVPDPDVRWYFAAGGIIAATPQEQNSSGYSYAGSAVLPAEFSAWTDADDTRYSISIMSSDTPEAIPEPATWVVAALLVGGAAIIRRRRKKAA